MPLDKIKHNEVNRNFETCVHCGRVLVLRDHGAPYQWRLWGASTTRLANTLGPFVSLSVHIMLMGNCAMLPAKIHFFGGTIILLHLFLFSFVLNCVSDDCNLQCSIWHVAIVNIEFQHITFLFKY